MARTGTYATLCNKVITGEDEKLPFFDVDLRDLDYSEVTLPKPSVDGQEAFGTCGVLYTLGKHFLFLSHINGWIKKFWKPKEEFSMSFLDDKLLLVTFVNTKDQDIAFYRGP